MLVAKDVAAYPQNEIFHYTYCKRQSSGTPNCNIPLYLLQNRRPIKRGAIFCGGVVLFKISPSQGLLVRAQESWTHVLAVSNQEVPEAKERAHPSKLPTVEIFITKVIQNHKGK